MADQRVDVHQRESGRAVAEQQDHLCGRPGDPGRDRVAEAGAEAAVWTGIEPAARLLWLDVLARVADEIAAVADHHGVRLKQPGKLAVDSQRVNRPRGRCAAGRESAAIALAATACSRGSQSCVQPKPPGAPPMAALVGQSGEDRREVSCG